MLKKKEPHLTKLDLWVECTEQLFEILQNLVLAKEFMIIRLDIYLENTIFEKNKKKIFNSHGKFY